MKTNKIKVGDIVKFVHNCNDYTGKIEIILLSGNFIVSMSEEESKLIKHFKIGTEISVTQIIN